MVSANIKIKKNKLKKQELESLKIKKKKFKKQQSENVKPKKKKLKKKLVQIEINVHESDTDTSGRLQSVIHQLASANAAATKQNADTWLRMCVQFLSSSKSSSSSLRVSACVAAYLLTQSPSSNTVSAATGDQRLFSHSTLGLLAKAVVKHVAPTDELHTAALPLFLLLLSTHPGACTAVAKEAEEKLLHWFNKSAADDLHADMLHHHVNSGGGGVGGGGSGAGIMAVAGSVWAKLPVPSAGGGGSVSGGESWPSVRLRQLLRTLDGLLDQLLANVLETQDHHSPPATGPEVLPLAFPPPPPPPMVAAPEEKNDANNEKKKKKKKKVSLTALTPGPRDLIEEVSLIVRRCVSVLLFIRQLLLADGVTLTLMPRQLLAPLVRIMQVSVGSLQRRVAAELRVLAAVWPGVQHAALRATHAAVASLGDYLSNYHGFLFDQLTASLVATSSPTTTTTTPTSPTSSTTATTTAITATTTVKAADIQETVSLLYRCLADVLKRGGGGRGVGVALARRMVQDLTAKVYQEQLTVQKSISSLSIKKKSKKKGYTIVNTINKPQNYTQPRNTTSNNTTNLLNNEHFDNSSPISNELSPNKQNQSTNCSFATTRLSVIKSSTIMINILDLLNTQYNETPHYVLDIKVATFLQDEIIALAWKMSSDLWFAGGGRGGVGGGGVSISGLVNVTDAIKWDKTILPQLFRVVGSLARSPHPGCPPPYSTLLRLLQHTQHAAATHNLTELYSCCCEGMASLGFVGARPSVSQYQRAVEDMHAEGNKVKLDEWEEKGEEEEEDGEEEEEEDDDEEEEVEEDEETVQNEGVDDTQKVNDEIEEKVGEKQTGEEQVEEEQNEVENEEISDEEVNCESDDESEDEAEAEEEEEEEEEEEGNIQLREQKRKCEDQQEEEEVKQKRMKESSADIDNANDAADVNGDNDVNGDVGGNGDDEGDDLSLQEMLTDLKDNDSDEA